MLPSLLNRSAFSPLYDFRREIDRLFEGTTSATNGSWQPPVDVVETGESIVFNLEVPGMTTADLDIRVDGNLLTISGEKKFEENKAENEKGYRYVERRYGRFQRSFTLPRTVETDRVKADYSNGVLTLVLPKTEKAKPRKIEIGK